MDVSITLTVTQELGEPWVELEGMCENEEGILTLTGVCAKIISLAYRFHGNLIPKTKEIPCNHFFLAIDFPSLEHKNVFLSELPTVR